MPSSSPPANVSATAPSPLTAYEWDLTAAHDARGQAATEWMLNGRQPLRLRFEGGQVSVRNLCNIVGAAYTTDGSRLQVNRPISTMRACADTQLMKLEQQVAAQLPTASSFSVQSGAKPQLSIQFADKSRWELSGTPTPQTQYGGRGERMFLEVGPQRVPCSNGVMKDAQCLYVRVVSYRENGVKLRVGPWGNFHTEIQGFTHEPGMRQILRVNRFVRKDVPADASAHVYVLDMVVESERMR
ncbi:META and DUF4377 domain-containing protein [Ottowia thiooxydans]|uniref:META and DUF4377 domain-containing protein n=1 Tax=Ottowia thiooxydans TaxID=219182 RepID=UPI001FE1AD85|nr:META and DUF4377 domain-containing protein [Ottowia thiooxydans]